MRPTLGVLPWAPEDGRGKGRPQPVQRPGWGGEEPNCSLATQGWARFWDGQEGGAGPAPGSLAGKGQRSRLPHCGLWEALAVWLKSMFVYTHTHTHTQMTDR